MTIHSGFAVDKHFSELSQAADVNGTIIGATARRNKFMQNLLGLTAASAIPATDGERRVVRTITNAELESLAASPVELIPAPGVGKMVYVLWWNVYAHFNGDAQDDATTDGDLFLSYAGGANATGTMNAAGLIDQTADRQMSNTEGWGGGSLAPSAVENIAVMLDNNGAEFTGGDTTLTVEVIYRIIDIDLS